jgi:predicted dinucleotide-binding enzyme
MKGRRTPVKIGIIGMGRVGSALGSRWAEAGHEVIFGVADSEDPKRRGDAQRMKAKLASVREAAAQSEVVVLAVPWKAVPEAIAAAGTLRDKVVLDCTNPLTSDLAGLEFGTSTSGGEQVALLAKGGKVVKIFNTTGAGNMADSRYGSTPVTMLHAGDEAGAKAIAAQLARDLGFDPIDLGPLTASRLLEPLALLWITLAHRQKLGTDFVLNVVRRPGN